MVDLRRFLYMQDATLNKPATQQTAAAGYSDGPRLLETLFPMPECRPSLRWLRSHQRELPHVRIGRLIYFDAAMVKAHLDAKGKGRK